MSETGRVIELDWGRIILRLNEVSIISSVEDPPKVRMSSEKGGSLGCLSFGRCRPGTNDEEEAILIQGKIDERAPDSLSGELTLHIRRDEPGLSDDASMRRVVTFRHDQILLGAGIALLTETT